MNQGFAVHGNILSPSECDEVLYSLLANRKPVKAGLRNLMGNERVQRLAYDSRLLEITKTIIGSDAIPFRATLFNKSGKLTG